MNKIYTREEMLEELQKDENLVVYIGYYVGTSETGEGLIKGSCQKLKGWAAEHSTKPLNEFYKVKDGFASKFMYPIIKKADEKDE